MTDKTKTTKDLPYNLYQQLRSYLDLGNSQESNDVIRIIMDHDFQVRSLALREAADSYEDRALQCDRIQQYTLSQQHTVTAKELRYTIHKPHRISEEFDEKKAFDAGQLGPSIQEKRTGG